MYRDENLDVNEECEDLRKSKCFNPYKTSPYYAMPCPMQMPMMQYPMMEQPMMQEPYQAAEHCSVCGKSKKYRDDEDFNLEGQDDRAQYSKPYYHSYYKPYYHPYHNSYYHPYYNHYSKPYYKPYHSYGPGYMNRDFEE